MTQPDLFSLPEERRPAPNPVREESVRLNAAAQRVLARLRDGLWHSNVDLVHVGGLRAVGRLWELQQQGHRIEKRHVRGGNWQYRLGRS